MPGTPLMLLILAGLLLAVMLLQVVALSQGRVGSHRH